MKKQHDIPLQSQFDGATLSRRRLFSLAGLALAAPILAGDSRPERREIPRGRYRKIVAIGDSYTAGRGASDPEHGYAALVAQMLEAETFINLAKDGWSAEEVLKGREHVQSQIEQIPSDADLLIGTVGGNAINLKEFANDCITDGCEVGTPAFSLALAVFRSDEYFNAIEQVYRAMLSKAPQATVAIVGYPKPVTPAPGIVHPIAAFMELFGITIRTSALGEENDAAMANVVDMLNEASRSVIHRIGDPRLMYLEAAQGISLVETAELGLIGVTRPPEFHDDTDPLNAGHPNDLGYQTMAETIVWQLSVPAGSREYNEASPRR